MTADTTPLWKRLWEAVAKVRDHHPRVFNDAPTDDVVAAILPIIAAEMQAAKAEAWQEGVNFALPNAETTWYPQHNPYRTTEHETGDQA